MLRSDRRQCGQPAEVPVTLDIQYARSGVFTPCDFAFPTDGRRAEATPNTEMILISDVNLNLLNELHTYGSVRDLKDRRNDLYEVRMKK